MEFVTSTRELINVESFSQLYPYLPEKDRFRLDRLRLLRERKDYHPEPSTYHHIEIVTNRLFETGVPELVLVGVYHDIFKWETARWNPKTESPTCPGHEKRASKHIQSMIDADTLPFDEINWQMVKYLCLEHMRVKQIDKMRKHKQDKLRNHEWFSQLMIFTRADNMLEKFKL